MRAALYASKVVAYAQGFDAIIAGRSRIRLEHRQGRGRPDLARRLHHPRRSSSTASSTRTNATRSLATLLEDDVLRRRRRRR